MDLLRRIELNIPDHDKALSAELLSFLSPFGHLSGSLLEFEPTRAGYRPRISISFNHTPTPLTTFITQHKQEVIQLTNSTGRTVASPHQYQSIDIKDFRKRLGPVHPVELDHVGFDLPWFDGVHPEVLRLRSWLKDGSAYHRSFTGDDWDFILPASAAELSTRELDYALTRRPKFEIVSINKVSTPILQFDLSFRIPYDDIANLFPEGIADPALKNVWVYLKNKLGLDICLVVGEYRPGDWSHLFEGYRL